MLAAEEAPTLGDQFSCFTGTKVQILTQKAAGAARALLEGAAYNATVAQVRQVLNRALIEP
jgi:hypothetical protein